MKIRFTATALLLLFVALLKSDDTRRRYYIRRTVSSATVNSIVIKQPTSGGRAFQFDGGAFCSTVASSVWSITKNGTVSGGSSGASLLMQLDERGEASTAVVTLDGTVSSSTAVNSGTIPTGFCQPVGGGLYLPWSSGTQKQIEFKITGSSGTHDIYTEWSEP